MLKEVVVGKSERRISQVEAKLDEHTRGMDELRDIIRGLDRRFDTLDQKMTRYFLWLAGFQITTLLALVTGLLGVIGVLLTR